MIEMDLQENLGLSRKDYMLKVAAEYIREYCPGGMIFFDEAECDGYCVADDCEAAADAD